MAVITLAGVQSTALGGAVGGLEVRAFLLNNDGTRTSTGITTTTDSNGRWSLSVDTDLSETGLVVARVMNTVTNEIRWVDSGIQVQVTSIVGPNGEAPLAAGSVVATHLASNSVTTAKILNGNVTTAKLADGNVTMEKLHPDVVAALGGGGGGGLAPNSVATVHIQDGAVTTTKLANNSVTGVKIPNGTISEAKLDAGVVAKLNAVGGGGGSIMYWHQRPNTGGQLTSSYQNLLSQSVPAGTYLVMGGFHYGGGFGNQTAMALRLGTSVVDPPQIMAANLPPGAPGGSGVTIRHWDSWVVTVASTTTINLSARQQSGSANWTAPTLTIIKLA